MFNNKNIATTDTDKHKQKAPDQRRFLFRALNMGRLLRVEVLPEADHDDRSGAQLHEGGRLWGASQQTGQSMGSSRLGSANTFFGEISRSFHFVTGKFFTCKP
jgi:hypothetical protein